MTLNSQNDASPLPGVSAEESASASFRVDEIFHAVADLSAEERAHYFDEHAIDEKLRGEVEDLVAFDSHSTVLIDHDIGQVAKWSLARFDPTRIRCGPYLLGDLLGRGGMGSVYAAERVDGEVALRVAVKLLLPGSDEPLFRHRFLAERQILANLSHPNVAKLLDAGHREDGQPYLVMEYVEGQPIDVYAAGIGLRQKIALFLKVCAAVSYLHRNLVVHRDLKPSNILVNWEGEPTVLDFGIAKMLDLTTDSTATSIRILTPDYASPEQVTGDAITTATDIYSLGAVLYRLLTGGPPHQFEGDSAAGIALAISTGKIMPPSRLEPRLKGDLEIILMKALRTEPHERYASVDALADDLRAFLERRPVQARSGDVWYKARKWLRLYWVPVVAAAVVIASLSAGLYVANSQRVVAERRFSQLRQLSDKIIDIDQAIRTLPGSIDARQRLVSASLDYLESLSREARGDLHLAEEISDGYWRMARIQGVNTEFNLGDTRKAEIGLTKADALIERVLASHSQDRNALFRSAVIAHDRMILADTEDRRPDVLAHAHKTVDRLEAFLRHDDPRDPVRLNGYLRPGEPHDAERAAVANLYANVALAYVNQHLYEDGARFARRTVAIAQPIASAQDVASKGLSILANALRYQGDLEGALGAIRQARRLAEQAKYRSPADRLFSLYGVMLREGRILGEADAVNLGRTVEAVQVLQQALNMIDSAAREDASDTAIRSRVGTAVRELGDILRDQDPGRALAVYDLGLRRLSEIPNNLKARRDRAELLANSSYSLRRLRRASEAKARIDAAFVILRQTKDYPANRIRPGSYVYAAVCALADYQAGTGDPRGAIQTYEGLLDKVSASQPKPEASLADAVRLSGIYSAIARLDRRVGRAGDAAALESRRLELWRRWDARLPNNGFVRRQLQVGDTNRSEIQNSGE